jgi:hypothetical protein
VFGAFVAEGGADPGVARVRRRKLATAARMLEPTVSLNTPWVGLSGPPRLRAAGIPDRSYSLKRAATIRGADSGVKDGAACRTGPI